MSEAGQSIADAGATQQEVVDKLALFSFDDGLPGHQPLGPDVVAIESPFHHAGDGRPTIPERHRRRRPVRTAGPGPAALNQLVAIDPIRLVAGADGMSRSSAPWRPSNFAVKACG